MERNWSKRVGKGRERRMEEFTYFVPTEVIFGRGAETRVGEAVRSAGGRRVLVLYGGGRAVSGGLLKRVTAALEGAGLTWFAKGGVRPNPRLSFVEETLTEYWDRELDFLLAVGGGSVIDTAKAVALGLRDPERRVWDFFAARRDPESAVPVGCVLTIAAAGSESSESAVITRDDTGEKRGRNTPLNRPKFAIMNPELTYSLPPDQTACGIADILMHTMDRYFTDVPGNETTDALAEAILRTVCRFGPVALERPGDYEARSELMWCGSLSHNDLTGLGRGRDFSVHQFGHELSGKYDIPHGESLSIMWPFWAKRVWRTDPARFARLGRNVFGVTEAGDEAAALACIEAVEGTFRRLGLPVSLAGSRVGVVSQRELEELAMGCSRGRSRSIGSFCPLDYEAVLSVYKAANGSV